MHIKLSLSSGDDAKLYLMVRLKLWRQWTTTSLLLFPGSVLPGVIGPVMCYLLVK